MENLSSKHCCIPLSSVIQYLSWWFNGFLIHFNGFFVWSGWWYKRFGWCWVERRKKCMLCCALLMQLGLKQSGENCTAQLSSQKWNGPVCCSQHSYFWTFPFKEEGGEGAGSESFRVHRFACWTWTTPEAILFSWSLRLLLDLGYRLWSLASHTKCSVSAGTWYRQLSFHPY